MAELTRATSGMIKHGLNKLTQILRNKGATFLSLLEMKSSTPATDGEIIELQSWATNRYSGGGRFRVDLQDTTSPDDGWLTIVTNSGVRLKRVVDDTFLYLRWSGLVSGNDATVAMKTAVAYLKAQVVAGLSPASAKVIVIDAGEYPISDVIEIPTAVRFISFGNVHFTTTLTDRCFDIKNDATIPTSGFSGMGDQYATFAGIGGTITLSGPGKDSTLIGFIFGNEATGRQPCRGVGLSNVIVRYCGDALRLRSKDTYLLTFRDLRLEQNNYNVRASEATSSNSGEATSWYNCVFGASTSAHLWLNSPAWEWVLEGCKFDYSSGDAIRIGSQCNYSSIKLHNCRGEEWRGKFLNSTPSALGNVSVMITNWSVLPRVSGNTAEGNSPSRPSVYVGQGTKVYVDGYEVFTEMRPYTEDLFLAVGPGEFIATNLMRAPYRMIPSAASVMNRGSKMEDEVVGTAVGASTLNRYSIDSISGVTGSVVSLDGGKAIQITGDSTSSYIRFLQKDYIPVRPGDQLGFSGAIQSLSSTGNRNFSSNILWYDKDLNLITTPDGDASYSFSSAYADTTLPNYSLGSSRKLSSSASSRIAPAGAAYARARWQMSAFAGTINLINLILFKA